MHRTFAPYCALFCFCLGPALLPLSASGQGDTAQDELAIDTERGAKKKKPPTPAVIAPLPPLAPSAKQSVLPSTRAVVPNATTPLSMAGQIRVDRIVLRGNTVLAPKQVADLVKPFLGDRSMEQLQSLRQSLSKFYLDHGYINTGVVIPDQKIENHTVVFQVVEGELSDVEITGTSRLSPAYLKSQVMAGLSKPLRLTHLQESLRLLQQDSLIEQVNAELNPGRTPGQGVLHLRVREVSPYYLLVGLDNHRSPSIGGEKLQLSSAYRNLFGRGEAVLLDLQLSEGLGYYGLTYTHPLNARGLKTSAYWNYSDSIVVEEPFDQIDIQSKSTQYGFNASYPFSRSLQRGFSLTAGLELKHNESLILKQPFSFSLGAVDGESDVSVLYTYLDWQSRLPNQVLALRGTLRLGLSMLGATENSGDLPDGEFILLQGQAQYARRLPFWQSNLLSKFTTQITGDSLLALEKFAVGGVNTVRGYRENQFVRDNAVVFSLEWRLPLLYQGALSEQQMFLVPFIDAGHTSDAEAHLSHTGYSNPSSTGLGLIWQPNKSIDTELYLAAKLTSVDQPEQKELQDYGVHFKLTYQPRF